VIISGGDRPMRGSRW